MWSGRRGSNPRHAAWKAAALPTELLPHRGRHRSPIDAALHQVLDGLPRGYPVFQGPSVAIRRSVATTANGDVSRYGARAAAPVPTMAACGLRSDERRGRFEPPPPAVGGIVAPAKPAAQGLRCPVQARRGAHLPERALSSSAIPTALPRRARRLRWDRRGRSAIDLQKPGRRAQDLMEEHALRRRRHADASHAVVG